MVERSVDGVGGGGGYVGGLVKVCEGYICCNRQIITFITPGTVCTVYFPWKIWFSKPLHASSHHLFSSLTCASSSGVKSLTMLNVFLISSGVFPLIMDATVAHVRSSRLLMSM